MIDRHSLVTRHNPVLRQADYRSPLTVGNGELAFTADITGMQTLYREFMEVNFPLCTMSQWGWHREPAGVNRDIYYTLNDLEMTEYDCRGRKVSYAVERKKGNEEVYNWLRQNPHRLNLARIALVYEGEEIAASDLSETYQKLNLYDGTLVSHFMLHASMVEVLTVCDRERDGLGFKVTSGALAEGKLKVKITFPYGSSDESGSNWEAADRHTTEVMENEEARLCLKRQLDRDSYYVTIQTDTQSHMVMDRPHQVEIEALEGTLAFSVLFTRQADSKPFTMEEALEGSRAGWKRFWENGAVIDLHRSKDKRALELERRIVLSQYLSAIQSCGSMPPQETGLTCNSWHGKFHLEMYLWHCAYLPLWNRTELMMDSLAWYRKHLPEAMQNAARNGYKGAKWPKQVAYDAIDSPSPIATLLIWQQPHIIYMLELAYQSMITKANAEDKAKEDTGRGSSNLFTPAGFLQEYWEVVRETAEYMSDFAVFNPKTGSYDLPSPIIPAQEEHDPRQTWNPTFELEYWTFVLQLAGEWARRLGIDNDQTRKWNEVAEHMAELPQKDGLYLAHENCPDTFEKFNRDHPSMVAALGLLPGVKADPKVMEQTLEKVLQCWELETTWGWDYAMMAMTAVRLGKPTLAIDIMLQDTPKNTYVVSGNNYQRLQVGVGLPLYLPGNGSLLLAVAMMAAGYKGCDRELPGFPDDGMWTVEMEDMNPFPY